MLLYLFDIMETKWRHLWRIPMVVVFSLTFICNVEGILSESIVRDHSPHSDEPHAEQESLLRHVERLFPGDYLNPFVNVHNRQARSESRSGTDKRTYEEDACTPMTQGEDLDIETAPVSRSKDVEVEWRRFADDAGFNRVVMGSVVFVKNPLHAVSVLEPSHRGTCSENMYFTTRSKVSSTAKNNRGGCKVAVNAGYFIPSNGKCLGNIVSEGHVVQTSSNIRNANFGIRGDGTLVTGYMPDNEVTSKKSPFIQLISGVIWLVRNGTNYVNASMREECRNLQNTGTMKVFVEIVSARTAVGHDKDGRLVIAKIEGQTAKRGANLYDFADLLIKHGVVNAINLDGGGSSQLVEDGLLVSYPSDHCSGNPEYRCERAVSTILCVHDIECPDNCSNHGDCDEGVCRCHSPWSGLSCDTVNCSQTNCSGNGVCRGNVCHCGNGWKGEFCNQTCPAHYYGPGCVHYCYCRWKVNSHCNQEGNCVCNDGFTGYYCNRPCPNDFFGPDCKERCVLNCSNHGHCSPVNGHCLCDKGWTGENCSVDLQTVVDDNCTANGSACGEASSRTGTASSTTSSSYAATINSTDNTTTVHSEVDPTLTHSSSPSSLFTTPPPVVATSSENTILNLSNVSLCNNNSGSECDCHLMEINTTVTFSTVTMLLVFGSLGTIMIHILICLVAQCVCGRKEYPSKTERRKKKMSYYSRLNINEQSDSASND